MFHICISVLIIAALIQITIDMYNTNDILSHSGGQSENDLHHILHTFDNDPKDEGAYIPVSSRYITLDSIDSTFFA